MEDFVESSSKKLTNIYQGLLDNNLIDESNLNISEILRDFYDVNKFLNISYIIFNNPNTDSEEKAKLLFNFRDSYGNKLLTMEQSRQAVTKSAGLVKFFQKIYKYKNNKRLFPSPTLSGGAPQAISFETDDPLNTVKNFDADINSSTNLTTYSDIYDWIFHPLWKLENHHRVGFLFPIPLDIVGSIIDAINFINPFVMIILSKLITWLGSAAFAGLGGAVRMLWELLG